MKPKGNRLSGDGLSGDGFALMVPVAMGSVTAKPAVCMVGIWSALAGVWYVPELAVGEPGELATVWIGGEERE